LITGAGGKTGQAVLQQLVGRGSAIRVLVKQPSQAEGLIEQGAAEAHVGDLTAFDELKPAFVGIHAVYHIPPNVHPQEEQIGENVMQLSRQAGVRHFVYHSVLRPYIQAMPHHLHKAHVEERIFTSGLDFTILQPAAYMQNTLVGLVEAHKSGVFKIPYPIDTRLGMVDLDEVAEVAAKVIDNPAHFGATYELCGHEILTPADIAKHISAALGRYVVAQEVDPEEWRKGADATGMGNYQVMTLLKMFEYYADFGFWGNSNMLSTLLGRTPKTYAQFLAGLDLKEPTSA
jgi:uncharacterized protein YbjT (DUF2867 family)